jgi:hypothetical protein
VTGCEFYNFSDGFNVGGDCVQATAFDISITDADIVAITGCRFNRTNSTSAPNRVNIQINPVATPSGGTLAQHILIAHNQFGDAVAGGGPFGISAVRIYATASDIRIGDNHYIGSYSGPVVDDQTGLVDPGAAVALLGYPTSSTSPPAPVVPNGSTTLGFPTLGSANVAWPANFSLAHFLQQPPANPILPGGTWIGWVIYTDHGTGNLMAYNGSTLKQLAP